MDCCEPKKMQGPKEHGENDNGSKTRIVLAIILLLVLLGGFLLFFIR